ncbi:MAG: nuclear transport factor 2 family protein [Pseudomonadales bacterium]
MSNLRVSIISVFAVCLVLFSMLVRSEPSGATRLEIDATVNKMQTFSAEGNMQAWATLFAEDAIFVNSALSEPVVGREAIVKMAGNWPAVENIREWKIIEGSRMAIGWRERPVFENGRTGGWYRGISTFVFNSSGQIKKYEGVFNVLTVQAAYKQ